MIAYYIMSFILQPEPLQLFIEPIQINKPHAFHRRQVQPLEVIGKPHIFPLKFISNEKLVEMMINVQANLQFFSLAIDDRRIFKCLLILIRIEPAHCYTAYYRVHIGYRVSYYQGFGLLLVERMSIY